jgi:uncharacterized protein (TIGR02246 family)
MRRLCFLLIAAALLLPFGSGLLIGQVAAPKTAAPDEPAPKPAAPESGETSPEETSPDEKSLQDAAVKFVEAYNKHDAAAVAALFHTESRMEQADGTVFEGPDEIAAAFEVAFAEEPKAAISLNMESLKFLTPDVAVEQGDTEYFPDGETLTSRSRYIALHLKKDGEWKMASARTLDREVISTFGELRQLEWLVGDWVDEGADSVVEMSCQWDEKKNFLLQEFQILVEGEVIQKGSQRIGWDAQASQLRSWIFDNDGGFGEAFWSKSDVGWTADLKGTKTDGGSVSGLRTVIVTDEDHFIVRTTNRVSDGESLPDLEYTMVRKAPAPAAEAK